MAFQSTTGIGTPVQIAVDSVNVTLSLSGTTTHQITATVQDVLGNPVGQLTLTAVANASGGSSVYTGTVTGGASNALAGFTFVIAGFVANAVNNGTFACTASSATTLTLSNPAGVAETHAATATPQGFVTATTFVYDNSGEQNLVSGTPTQVATVSGSGLITAGAKGQTTIEVAYPFANATGTVSAIGSNWPINKIFKLITVQVNP